MNHDQRLGFFTRNLTLNPFSFWYMLILNTFLIMNLFLYLLVKRKTNDES